MIQVKPAKLQISDGCFTLKVPTSDLDSGLTLLVGVKNEQLSSRGLLKLTQNEIIYMNKAKEIMFYDIYSIKHY